MPRIRAHTAIVHLAVFLLSPHRHLHPVPSTRRSGTNASTPTAKKLSLVVVYLSEASLHRIIHSSCPALECLLIVLGIEIGISCLQIKPPHLKSIGICFEGQQLIIEDAPSLQRLLLHYCYKPSQITVISAPKTGDLGCNS